MSGIFGFWHLDGAQALAHDLQQMASVLAHRGPDSTGAWHDGAVGVGHALLATTPEALFERLPLVHTATGCVITADVRLDNRGELLAALGLRERAATIGDAEIILMAYLAWGGTCVERLLGDFAFAIWDARQKRMFCARDQFGMRPFNYYHAPGRFLAFASEPEAILIVPQTPYRINEGRIADFLVEELEGMDTTSTFFEELYRLPPAHTMTVSADGVRIQRYWKLEPGTELRLRSDDAYAEAFLEVFIEAVGCRLRSAGSVGSMLSGGMDSGSVVAVARTLLKDAGRGPLNTFSAMSPHSATCVETRAIQSALTMDGLNPCTVTFEELEKLMPALEDLTCNQGEPFDEHMTLIRAVYLIAQLQGVKVVLDGGGGDIVLNEGSHLARLWRSGHWLTAWSEAVGHGRFWGDDSHPWRELYCSARSASTPNWVRHVHHRLTTAKRLKALTSDSMISPDFARRICLDERLRLYKSHRPIGISHDYSLEHAQSIDHPNTYAGSDRYNRVAASVGVEPRDPFKDRRVVAFCLSLPGEQKLGGGGWPKIILRRAMAGRLPDAVRWRRGKQHLGASFTSALIDKMRQRMRDNVEQNCNLAAPYVNATHVQGAYENLLDGTLANGQFENVYSVFSLCEWLRSHAQQS